MRRGCHVLRSVAFLLLLLFVLQLLQDVQHLLRMNLWGYILLLTEKSLQKREREESTPRRTPVRKRKRPASQEPSTSYTPGGFWTLLYHPQAHLEQSALLLLFYDFFGSHRSPLGSANKSKNQKINCSISVVCCLTLFIPPEHSYFFNFKSLHCIHFWSYRDDTHMVGLVRDRRIKLQIFFFFKCQF